MALIVQKYGGTSVGDIARIKNVVAKVKARAEAGNRMVVVLSAMAGIHRQPHQAGQGDQPRSGRP